MQTVWAQIRTNAVWEQNRSELNITSCCRLLITIANYLEQSSMGVSLAPMTLQNPTPNKGIGFKMTAIDLWPRMMLWRIWLHLGGWVNALDHEKVASRPRAQCQSCLLYRCVVISGMPQSFSSPYSPLLLLQAVWHSKSVHERTFWKS